MRRYNVHLNALRAFEAAARCSSFSQAADELHVSHSTISHHVNGLEKMLGVRLFDRQNRKVVLTKEGEVLFPVLRTSFDSIATALEKIRNTERDVALNVTVTPTFANKWMVPNLRKFQARYPGVDVQLHATMDLVDFNAENMDVGIRTGGGKWPGLRSELLIPVHMTPLCSPDLLKGFDRPLEVSDLLSFTLIHADVSRGVGFESEWRNWLDSIGATDMKCERGLSFRDPGLALQAAIDGLGVAMGYVELAKTDIDEGRLVRLFEHQTTHPWSYYIVLPEGASPGPMTEVFCAWLRERVSQG